MNRFQSISATSFAEWKFSNSFDVQILERNCPESIHQRARGLMSKIEPSVGDSFEDVCNDLFGFLPFGSAFLCS